MYLVGGPHAHKIDAQRILEGLIIDRRKLVTDAEVFQEILHRYVAINRRMEVHQTFETVLRYVDEVFPISLADVQRAKEIVLGTAELSARDAIHAAVMESHGIGEIVSFDRGFDALQGIRRLS
jgi:hypothetical protein